MHQASASRRTSRHRGRTPLAGLLVLPSPCPTTSSRYSPRRSSGLPGNRPAGGDTRFKAPLSGGALGNPPRRRPRFTGTRCRWTASSRAACLFLVAWTGLAGIGPAGIGPAARLAHAAQPEPADAPARSQDATPEKESSAEPAAEAAAEKGATKTRALTGAQIHTMGPAGQFVGTILIRDGKLVELGAQVEIPSDAEQIDATGMVITPGWIDSRSTLWLTPAAARETANDGSLRAVDGVDFTSDEWQEVVRSGITAVYVQPASSGNLGGGGAVLRVRPATSLSQIVLREQAALQASIGVANSEKSSSERWAQYDRLKKAFESAKAYRKQWEDYEAALQKEAEKKAGASEDSKEGGKPDDGTGDEEKKEQDKQQDDQDEPDTDEKRDAAQEPEEGEEPAEEESTDEADKKEDGELKRPARDPAKEFLLQALDGKVPLRLEVHRVDDVQMALKLADEFTGLSLVLDGVSHPQALAETLAGRQIPLVLGPVFEEGSVPAYRRDRPRDWLTQLLPLTPRWALASFAEQGRGSRSLRAQAATAVAEGVPREQVLAAVTSHAALLLGIDEQVGSLEPGKEADLAVFAGDPLDPSVPVRMVLSGGEVVFEQAAEPVALGPAVVTSGLPSILPERYAVRSRRVLNSNGDYAPATVVVAAGRIVETGDVDPGSDTPLFDLGDAVVTPGLVASATTLGGAARMTESSDPLTPELRVADTWEPENRGVEDFVRGGFLTLVVTPGTSNVASGLAAAVRPASGDPTLAAELAGVVSLSQSARNQQRFPSSLAGQYQLLGEALSGNLPRSRLLLPAAAESLLQQERADQFQALTAGRPVLMDVDTRAEVAAALRLIQQHPLRTVLLAPGAWDGLEELMIRGQVGLIARPVRDSDPARYLQQLVSAANRGVPLAFAGRQPREIRATVAAAVAEGLPRATARRALTFAPPMMLGFPGGVPWTAESPADFVVWSDCPLNLQARPLDRIVDGQRLAD